jgi:putative DNA primase/helicase
MKRFSRSKPCPICGGWDDARRGHGERCFGFLSDDGNWAHCTREEFAGGLPMKTASSTYAHALRGNCKCSARHHNDAVSSDVAKSTHREIVATYDFKDAKGVLLFQVVRWQPKGFSQRRPDGSGDWIWNLRGVKPVLYRLPELLSADPREPVFVGEGEKDVDNLARLGLVCTTNCMGAGKWRNEYCEVLRGRKVVLLPDNDPKGSDHMQAVAQLLEGVASSVKIVELPNLPEKGDASDWLAAGGTLEALNGLVEQTQEYSQETKSVCSAEHDSEKCAPRPAVSSSHPHLTDLGNAQRLVKRHGADLKFCHEQKKWLVWDGTRWAVDSNGEVERRAKHTVISIYAEAAEEEDADRRGCLAKWAAASESRGRISAMIELAKTEPDIPISLGALDANPFLLNCQNGTVNLRTGELQDHRRDDFCTKLVSVSYDPVATCPLFLDFLDQIMDGNDGLTTFLQRAVGYSLTGSTEEHVIFVFHGGGANGKSTLVETVRTLLGDYAATADPNLLLAGKDEGVRNDVARLAGSRFVSTVETPAGKRMAETLVKQLTGGDRIAARFLYCEFFEFTAQFKLVLATNYRPRIYGTDKGIWRRIRLVPFNVTIPDADQDKELPNKLRCELPGILAWALKGCLKWQEHGLGVPPEVSAATESYRQEMDVLGAFLAECCHENPALTVPVRDLYQAYACWCDENGEQPLKKRDLGIQLSERGFAPYRDKRVRFRIGLALMTRVTQDDADSGKTPDKNAHERIYPNSASPPSSLSPESAETESAVMEVEL